MTRTPPSPLRADSDHAHHGGADARASVEAPLALWLSLAVLTALTATLAFVPSMWAWSLNLLRFVPPWPGWTLWALAALSLVPALSRRLTPGLSAAGDWIAAHPVPASLLAGVLVAALLAMLPDRAWFTGDFIFRNPAVASNRTFSVLFYEDLPLDNFLHASLPRLASRLTGITTDAGARGLGAIEGALFVILAVQFVRATAARGVSAFAAFALLIGGGYLTMFTGFAKTAGELCIVTLGLGLAALRIARGQRGLPLALLAASAGLLLHRSALFLVPIVVALAVLAWSSEISDSGWKRPSLATSSLIFVATAVVILPRIIAIVGGFDVSHHLASPEVERQGGVIRSALTTLRVVDLANALIALSPLVVAIPALLVMRGARIVRERGGWLLGAMALYPVGVAFFLHPHSGFLRDWDVIAWIGVGLSMLTAWLLIDALRQSPRAEWCAIPVCFVVVLMTGLWLIHDTNVPGALARARAVITEAPRRPDVDRSDLWLYLGDRTAELGRWGASAEAMRRAAESQPSPSVLVRWGTAAAMSGDLESARTAWTTMTARVPSDPAGWGRLALIDLELGRYAEARMAARELVRLAPADSSARALLEEAERSNGAIAH